MTENFTAPELPLDLESIPDITAVEYMKQLVRDRREKGTMIPRFVTQLNAAGYTITLADYKNCESKPAHAIGHIRSGLTHYAYKILNRSRVENSPQDPYTTRAMEAITAARIERDYTYLRMAQLISATLGIPVSESEYRTAEQGITKIVPYAWVIIAADILKVDLGI